MKNWNTTGKIKALILAIMALPNLLMPIGAQGQIGLTSVLMPLLFGSLAIPLITKFNQVVLKAEIAKPDWNNNPLKLKRPLSFFQFAALFFITVGLSMLLGTAIKFQWLSFFGLTVISFGLGILTGIWLALKWLKPKYESIG